MYVYICVYIYIYIFPGSCPFGVLSHWYIFFLPFPFSFLGFLCCTLYAQLFVFAVLLIYVRVVSECASVIFDSSLCFNGARLIGSVRTS